MNTILYPFNFQFIYDCAECKGLCCMNNRSVNLTENQKDNLLKDNLLKFLIKKRNGNYELTLDKLCWFQSDSGCVLSENNRPISCSLYPLSIKRWFKDTYAVLFIPCPNYKIDNTESRLPTNLINSFIKNINLPVSFSNDENIERDYNKKYKNFIDNYNINMFDPYITANTLTPEQNSKLKKILYLFPQVYINPYILFKTTESIDKDILMKYYTIFEEIIKNKTLNLQQTYTLGIHLFLKYINL